MRNHTVFTLWLLMIRERVIKVKVPRISRKTTSCKSGKGSIWRRIAKSIKDGLKRNSFLIIRKLASNEQRVYSGNKLFSHVEAVGTFRLILKTGYILDLENVFFIPCFSRNLISVSKLDIIGFSFWFINSTFSIFKGGHFIGGGTKIDLDPNFENNHISLHYSVGTKRSLVNENSALLWHMRLWHISIERIKRLVNDGVLKTIDFTDFGTCVDCIKGKQTNKTTKSAKMSFEILEILHTDICGPFSYSLPK